jgi:CubicO group peptidase (beta-lactamase class C family)
LSAAFVICGAVVAGLVLALAVWLGPRAAAPAPPAPPAPLAGPLTAVPPALPAVSGVAPGAGAAPPLEAPELQAFFDQLIPGQLQERHIPGATVAVVRDGSVVFARGYGWADAAQRTPVVADRTLFHIGSTAKLFTWTAVMQLVEQGRLDLDADVTTYLDFPIPATYPEPITLGHLMSHTAGFENRDLVRFGWTAPTPEELTPLGPWLAANVPARVRPPGVEAGYSNYGAALAGYVVSRAAGVPFEQYVEQHLLEPLEMRRSLVRQAVPAELAPEMARGFVFEGGAVRERPLSVYQGAPTGAVRATATDVAQFMVAHLQDGRYGDRRVLDAATARRMRQTLFRPDPRLNGFAYGFMEWDRNGRRVLGHIGSAAPVHYSLLALLPDDGVGLFVAYNSGQARPLTVEGRTLAAFLDRFYPAPPTAAPVPAPDAAGRLSQFAGEYRRNNFEGSYTTFEKLYRVLAATNRRITDRGDGTLEVRLLEGTALFVETAPDYFREVGGQDALLFRRDARGRVSQAVFSGVPEYTYERLSWAETPAFNRLLLVVCVALFGSVVLAAGGSWALGRLARRRPPRPPQGRLAAAARWSAGAVAALNLAFVGGLVLELGDPGLLGGDFWRLQQLLLLPLLATALTPAVLLSAALAWRRRLWGLPGRLHYTAVALAAVAFVWFAATWNLLGFNF